MKRSYRAFLAIAATCALLATACGSDDDDTAESATDNPTSTSETSTSEAAEEEYDIAVAAFPGSLGSLGPWVAQEKGFFADAGLNVELIQLGSQGALISALQSGTAQVVPAVASDVISLKQRDADVRVVAHGIQAIGNVAFAAPDVDVPAAAGDDWKDTILALNGKSIGSPSGAVAVHALVLQALMVEAGGSADDLTFVNIGSGGPMISALAAGQIDIGLVDLGTAIVAEEQGFKPIFDFTQDGPEVLNPLPLGTYLSSDRQLERFPDLAQRFFDAMSKTTDYMKDPDNLDELHDIAVNVAQIPESDDLDQAITETVNLKQVSVTPDRMTEAFEFYVQAGIVEATPSVAPEDYHTEQALGQ